MTISFRCPWCNSLCGFGDKYAERRAKCVTCQKKFIIPVESNVKPKKVIEKAKIKEKPKKGFLKAIFKDSWSSIFCVESRKTLFHLEILVILKLIFFFLTVLVSSWIRVPDNVGDLFIFLILLPFVLLFAFVFCCIFGRIIELYMTFLDETACGVDQLPPPCNDLELPIWEHMLKPFFVFVLTIFGAFLPFLIGCAFFEYLGLDKQKLFAFYKDEPAIILQVLWVMGVLSIPSAYIHISMTGDWEYLIPNKLLKPVLMAFLPYMLVFVMFAGVFYLVHITDLMSEITAGNILGIFFKSLGIMAGHIYVLWTVRAAGLFYRHFGCYFKI